MLTIRRTALAALVLLSIILILRSTHSSTSPNPPAPKQPLAPLRTRLRSHFRYDLTTPTFPSYIWQTWKYTPQSIWFNPELVLAESSWSDLHPDFTHQVIPDDTQRQFIQYLYAGIPEVYEAFTSLPLAVLKADFFRYLILLARGGVYADIDTTALRPVREWLPPGLDLRSVGLVVGIEADPDRPDWQKWYSRRIQFCQWTIQAKPGHPVLREIVARITEDALRMKRAGLLARGKTDKTIVEFTGPGVWTDTLFAYFNDPAYFAIPSAGGGMESLNVSYDDFTDQVVHRRVGDVVVLPITSFSPGVGQMGAQDVDDPMAFVQHEFGGMSFPSAFVVGKTNCVGTWKTDPSL